MLTNNDIQNILKQCANQHTMSPLEVARFTAAYAAAEEFSRVFIFNGDEETAQSFEVFIRELSRLISNNFTYRKVPVTFANSGSALEPELIDRAMWSFSLLFVSGSYPSGYDVYQDFERIHPFCDGNGRLGHLLWAIYNRHISYRNLWPTGMPPSFDPNWTPERGGV